MEAVVMAVVMAAETVAVEKEAVEMAVVVKGVGLAVVARVGAVMEAAAEEAVRAVDLVAVG